jgi:hypothetical protein
MAIPVEEIRSTPQQQFLNGEIHDWYRFVWGYSDHLVAKLLREFKLDTSAKVLDPFCGTGTTLVECLKQGMTPTGVDANPASVFATRVKTNWTLRSNRVLELLDAVLKDAENRPRKLSAYSSDATYSYLRSSGMLERRWISPQPLQRALAIKHSIADARTTRAYRDFLTLALLATVVQDASNVRFGPELYIAHDRADVDVGTAFAERVVQMALELSLVESTPRSASVLSGDARQIDKVVASHARRRKLPPLLGKFDAVICSPPYPAEHDYTRNARLELAFLESVDGLATLRAVKRRMIRSHTKGIYVNDTDWTHVWLVPSIAKVVARIERRTRSQNSGFSKYYSTVIASYFGGMLVHLKAMRDVLVPGARLAYVVSDQASYANVHIPTASILAELADECGFEVQAERHWRSRQASKTARLLDEHILLLRWPGTKRGLRGA